MKYRTLSTSALRGLFIAPSSLGVLSSQRAAIARELAVRAWAEAVEAQLRGGRS